MTKQEIYEYRQQRIMPQEDTDYNKTQRIFTSILDGYDCTFTQTGLFDPSDMRFNYTTTNGATRKFNVEIKTKNQDMTKFDDLPLKVSKYCDFKDDTQPDEKMLFVVLVNDDQYFIYDLDNLNWNTVTCRNWWINDYEYNPDGEKKKVKTPTFFVPIDQACTHGIIPS